MAHAKNRTRKLFYGHPYHPLTANTEQILNFLFEFAEGQNTKIHAKYQNSFQAQNAKISAVSTPILTAKAAFFRIFRALSEKSVENGSKERKKPSHQNSDNLEKSENL